MKIVYFSASPIPSPAANSVQVMKMCSAFAGLDHDVHLVVPTPDSDSTADIGDLFQRYGIANSFQIHRVPVLPDQKKKKRAAAIRMVELAKYIGPDLIYGRNLSAALIAADAGFPIFHELHHLPRADERWMAGLENWSHKLQILNPGAHTTSKHLYALSRLGALGEPERLLKNLMSYPNLLKVFAITHSLKNALEQKYPELQGRVAVAPDGADAFPDSVAQVQLQKRPADLEIGYTGHLYPGKGMEVIPAVAERCPWANFHIVGGREEHVAHWRAALGSLDNIFMYGAVPPHAVPSYINALDVCLLPNQPQIHVYSRRGRQGADIAPFTSPLKMFEYMAAGKAIAASDLDVLKEVLVDGRNALLCRHDDPEMWQSALEHLRHDRQLRDRLGRQALEDFRGTYEWSSRARRILKHFENVEQLERQH